MGVEVNCWVVEEIVKSTTSWSLRNRHTLDFDILSTSTYSRLRHTLDFDILSTSTYSRLRHTLDFDILSTSTYSRLRHTLDFDILSTTTYSWQYSSLLTRQLCDHIQLISEWNLYLGERWEMVSMPWWTK